MFPCLLTQENLASELIFSFWWGKKYTNKAIPPVDLCRSLQDALNLLAASSLTLIHVTLGGTERQVCSQGEEVVLGMDVVSERAKLGTNVIHYD